LPCRCRSVIIHQTIEEHLAIHIRFEAVSY
jgi:hypothetical protein